MSGQLKGFLFILLADFLWGLSATLAKYLFNRQISPFDLVQIRLTLSFLLLAAWLAVLKPGLIRISRGDIPYIMIFGVFGMAAVQFTYYYTISETNVATAVFLQYLAPAFILLYGLITRRETVSGPKLAALAGATAGGLLIVKGTAGAGMAVTVPGLISGLGSAAAFAFYTLYGKYGLARYSPWTLLAWGMGVGGAAWTLYRPPWVTFSSYGGGDWLFFLYIAVFATIIPFGLYLKGLSLLPPLITGITSTLEPVMAGVISYLILGEVLTAMQITGCALIIAAVALLQLKPEGREAATPKNRAPDSLT
ncbi:MAG: DMT family transporter [Peptococcaceae bacterium]|nr:DMT family transporter [Peptococcaceae bacterium]